MKASPSKPRKAPQQEKDGEAARLVDLGPARIFGLIDRGIQARKKRLGRYAKIMDRIAGESVTTGSVANAPDFDPESFAYEYVDMMLPRLAYDNPRVQATPRRTSTAGKKDGKALGFALTEWCENVDFVSTAEELALDYLVGFAAAFITPTALPWIIDDGSPELPRVHRISPEEIVYDPSVKNPREAEFIAHRIVCSKAALLEYAERMEWALEPVRALKPSGVPSAASEPDERMVELWHFWFRPGAADERGKCAYAARTLNEADKEASKSRGWVCEPYDFQGPRSGPYVIFGHRRVPASPYPFGPLLAFDPQVQEHGDGTRDMMRMARSYRRKLLHTAKNPGLASAMARPDTQSAAVETLDPGTWAIVEVGGLQPHQIPLHQMSRDRIERLSGLHEVMRGNVNAKTTATAVAVAEGAGNLRSGSVAQKFRAGILACLKIAAWHVWHGEGKAIELGSDAQRGMGVSRPSFRRGRKTGFDGFLFSIAAYSMERADQATQQRKALLLLDVLGRVAPAMPATPHVRWKNLVTAVGDLLELDLEELIDLDQLPTGGGGSRSPGDVLSAAQGEAEDDAAAQAGAPMGGLR